MTDGVNIAMNELVAKKDTGRKPVLCLLQRHRFDRPAIVCELRRSRQRSVKPPPAKAVVRGVLKPAAIPPFIPLRPAGCGLHLPSSFSRSFKDRTGAWCNAGPFSFRDLEVLMYLILSGYRASRRLPGLLKFLTELIFISELSFEEKEQNYVRRGPS